MKKKDLDEKLTDMGFVCIGGSWIYPRHSKKVEMIVSKFLTLFAIGCALAGASGTFAWGLDIVPQTGPSTTTSQKNSNLLPRPEKSPPSFGKTLTAEECNEKKGVVLPPRRCTGGKNIGFVRDMLCSCVCCIAKLVDCKGEDKVSIAHFCVTPDHELKFDYTYNGPHHIKSIRFDFLPLGTSAATAKIQSGTHELKTSKVSPSPFNQIADYAVTFSDDIRYPGGNDASCYEKLMVTPKTCADLPLK